MVSTEEDEAWRDAALAADPGLRLVVTGGKCLISREDWSLVQDISMSLDKDGYVCIRHEGYRFLHNFLMQHSDPLHPVDHWNECPWDNRRPNLRIITRAHNTDRHRRLNAEEARILQAHSDKQLVGNVHAILREYRNRRKL